MKSPLSSAPARTVIVIKVGGALLERQECVHAIWDQVRELQRDHSVVVVHGGGAQATELARRLGHEPRMIHGRRITTDIDLEVVKAAFGIANIELVAAGKGRGVSTVGLTGVDGASLLVHRRPTRIIDGEQVDFGWVGDVEAYRPELLISLFESGHVPVVAPLGVDADGLIYNVNADTVASEVAAAVSARALLFVTDSGGVRRDVADEASIIAHCTPATVQAGVSEGWINAGMRTKVEVALAAAAKSSAEIFIVGYDDLNSRSRATRVTADVTVNPL